MHQGQCEAVFIVGSHSAATQDHLGLLHRFAVMFGAGADRDVDLCSYPARCRLAVLADVPAGSFQRCGDQLAQLLMVQPAGSGDDQFLRAVPAGKMVPDIVAAGLFDGLRGAADRPAQRVPVEHLFGKTFVDDVARVILGHGQLFQDHPALGLHLCRIDHCGGHHIGEDLHRYGQIGIQYPGVVAGGLFAGHRIGLATYGVKGCGDVQSRALGRALEQQMLEEVGRAVLMVSLVPGTHGNPEADAH